MDPIYNEKYFKEYDIGVGKVDYQNSHRIKERLIQAAAQLREQLQPASVLDVGCAMGQLVAALREQGVDAYGVDISHYAISQVCEKIRPFCKWGDLEQIILPESFPQTFDLVLCVDVLSCIPPEKHPAVIRRLCSLGRRVLLSDSCLTASREVWAEVFLEEKFLDDLRIHLPALGENTALFTRNEDVNSSILAYEKYIRLVQQESRDYREKTAQELRSREDEILLLQKKLRDLQARYNFLKTEQEDTLGSSSWKVTKPLRSAVDGLRSFRETHSLKTDRIRPLPVDLNTLEAQRKEKFPTDVCFSVLLPVQSATKKELEQTVDSLLAQTYPNWELCLTGDGETDFGYLVQKDSRIRCQKLENNSDLRGSCNAALEMAQGNYFAFIHSGDLLHPSALYEVMQALCREEADLLYTDERDGTYGPCFKPDYSPDTLRSCNYLGSLTVFSRELLQQAGGGLREGLEGGEAYDLVLRLTECAQRIVHIPKLLYDRHSGRPAVSRAGEKRAVEAQLHRLGLEGCVLDGAASSVNRVSYKISGSPLISILIPNKDHIDDLQKCIDSIRERSSYPNWEVIVVENNSTEPETFAYYKELQKDTRIRMAVWEREFNYSAINNFGADFARGDYLLLLNNDVEVINPDWLEQMLMFAQRPDVGAVGAKLYYPDDTVQHGGVILGIGGVGGHSHKNFGREDMGYMGRLVQTQNLTAVTAACLMLRRDVWDEVRGLDEAFQVAFNDVDFCMRIRQAGYLIVWTPYAQLYHYESKSRGVEDTAQKRDRFDRETQRFQQRWQAELQAGDPYYNPNLTLDREDFSPKVNSSSCV